MRLRFPQFSDCLALLILALPVTAHLLLLSGAAPARPDLGGDVIIQSSPIPPENISARGRLSEMSIEAPREEGRNAVVEVHSAPELPCSSAHAMAKPPERCSRAREKSLSESPEKQMR